MKPDYIDPEIFGFMMTTELQWLYTQAQRMGSIAEIGCWKGKSTHALLSGCSGPVFAVDHWKGSEAERTTGHAEALTQDIYAQFMANVGHFKNLVVRKMDSVEAARHFAPHSIDMVWIDGGLRKQDVIDDLTAWVPVCRKLLCGHDLNQGGVAIALLEMGINYTTGAGSIWSYDLERLA